MAVTQADEDPMTSDRQLQLAVLEELSWEPGIAAAHIGVAAHAGVVTLTGHVENYGEKFTAEKATMRVKGVRAIAEELDVRLPFETQRNDDDIAAAAIERLAWDAAVPRDSVGVRVETGWVTLTGEVNWYYQKAAATLAVRPLRGVVGVSDQITIRPQVDTSSLTDDITHALHRSWFFDPQMITVSARGGAVRLSGSVQSWPERQVAADIAWAALGTTAVDNALRVV
jgi:osmotically-inducible protein OsmY